MTAADYLAWVGRIRGLSPAAARRRSADLLELLRLLPGPAARTGSLSTGNLRKLGIGQAFVITAGLVVLDEPRAGLDPTARVVLDQLVRAAVAAGSVVITADHEPSAAGGERRFALQDGKLAPVDDSAKDGLHYVITATGPSGEASTVNVPDGERDRRLAELLASGWSVTGVRADVEH
jgi:ABC-type multidrug transport system ATPase subunit